MDNMADNTYTAEAIAPDNTEADAAIQDTGAAAGEADTAGNGQQQQQQPAGQDQRQEEEIDVTRTRAFAQRLKERTDTTIGAVGLINPYTGQPVRNERDLRAFRRMQMAEADGRDVDSAAGESELLEQLGEYKLREQEAAILADPDLAPFYDEYRDDVQMICNMARLDGRDVDMDLALRTVMAQHMGDIRKRDAERIRQDTIRHYDAQAKASPGSISGSETPPHINFATMPKEEFEKWQQRALRGELKSST